MKNYVLIAIVGLLVIAGGVYYVEEHNGKTDVSTSATSTEAAATGASFEATAVLDDGTEVPVTVTTTQNIAVTQTENGKTLHVKKGTRVVVALGDDTWVLSVRPDGILTRIKDIGSIRGVQAIYTTDKTGTATIAGEGRPKCASGAACAQYIVNFSAKIVVE